MARVRCPHVRPAAGVGIAERVVHPQAARTLLRHEHAFLLYGWTTYMAVTSDNNTIIAVGETFNRRDWETIPESAIAGEQSFPEHNFETLNASI